MGATVSKSMLIRIWATKSLLTLITEALSALPTSHSRAQRALPSPHTEEAGRFLAPHSAPLPKPLPLSTHPAEHPVGHKPQAPYRAGNRARTPTGGAARPLATSPRSGPSRASPHLERRACASILLGSVPKHLPVLRWTSFCKPRPHPALCEAHYKLLALQGALSPGAAHSTTRGSSAQAPNPLTRPSTLTSPRPRLRPAGSPTRSSSLRERPFPRPLPVAAGIQSTSVTKRFPTKLQEEKGRRGGALRGPREAVMFLEMSGNPLASTQPSNPQSPEPLKAEPQAARARTTPERK